MTSHPAGRPAMVLVESNRKVFTEHVLGRTDVDTVLIRPPGGTSGIASQAEASYVHSFRVLDVDDLPAEARRYRRWLDETGLRPNYFCNPNEAFQHVAQEFAGLVGLPHLSGEQVTWVRDKAAMKDRYVECGIPCAAYRLVRTSGDIAEFTRDHGWPVVLKPVAGDTCVDTFKLSSAEELQALGTLTDTHEWMVEEYIEGDEYQLCALVVRRQVVKAFLSKCPAPVLDSFSGAPNGHTTYAPSEPTPIDPEVIATKLVDALQLSHGYLHGEFFLTPDGRFVMGEVAARMAGNAIPENHSLAYGFDCHAAALDVYLDRIPDIRVTADRAVGELLLPARPGLVRSVTSAEELLACPGVIRCHIDVGPGDIVPEPKASRDSAGRVHIAGATVSEVETRMRQVLAKFSMVVSADGRG